MKSTLFLVLLALCALLCAGAPRKTIRKATDTGDHQIRKATDLRQIRKATDNGGRQMRKATDKGGHQMFKFKVTGGRQGHHNSRTEMDNARRQLLTPHAHTRRSQDLPRPTCPPGMPVPMCMENPCNGKTCANAKCRRYLCGGCYRKWYDTETGEDVTEDCESENEQ